MGEYTIPHPRVDPGNLARQTRCNNYSSSSLSEAVIRVLAQTDLDSIFSRKPLDYCRASRMTGVQENKESLRWNVGQKPAEFFAIQNRSSGSLWVEIYW